MLGDLVAARHVDDVACGTPHDARSRYHHAVARSQHDARRDAAARWPVGVRGKVHQHFDGAVVGADHRPDLGDGSSGRVAGTRRLVESDREAGSELAGEPLREREHRPQSIRSDDRDDRRAGRDVVADRNQAALDDGVDRAPDVRPVEAVLGLREPRPRVVEFCLPGALLRDGFLQHAFRDRLRAQFLVTVDRARLVGQQGLETLDARAGRGHGEPLRLSIQLGEHLAFLDLGAAVHQQPHDASRGLSRECRSGRRLEASDRDFDGVDARGDRLRDRDRGLANLVLLLRFGAAAGGDGYGEGGEQAGEPGWAMDHGASSWS